ncbi:MAG: HD domain-containing protein [Myxococcota bacterium]|jgi:(p)ppGpp synthase/HD superfamily hydrolase|nr:HD domain-containing protein [Myxococcota bacterium]
MSPSAAVTSFLEQYQQALLLAVRVHARQIREDTHNRHGLPLPYITHPVAVAALVQRHDGTADQQLAALLHDVLEDGGREYATEIRNRFGTQVLALVEFCTDGTPDASGAKPPWRLRKTAYLEHLAQASGEGLLVAACDKLVNLQAIRQDLAEVGDRLWDRFTGGKEGSLWYYQGLVAALTGRTEVPATLQRALALELQQVLALARP